MRVLAYPNRHYPPSDDVLALASGVLQSLHGLTARVEFADTSSRKPNALP